MMMISYNSPHVSILHWTEHVMASGVLWPCHKMAAAERKVLTAEILNHENRNCIAAVLLIVRTVYLHWVK